MSNEESVQHKTAIIKVQWALQEAYKIAVHNAGITDWSQEKPERKREVEIDQIKIAEMILNELERARFISSKLKGRKR